MFTLSVKQCTRRLMAVSRSWRETSPLSDPKRRLTNGRWREGGGRDIGVRERFYQRSGDEMIRGCKRDLFLIENTWNLQLEWSPLWSRGSLSPASSAAAFFSAMVGGISAQSVILPLLKWMSFLWDAVLFHLPLLSSFPFFPCHNIFVLSFIMRTVVGICLFCLYIVCLCTFWLLYMFIVHYLSLCLFSAFSTFLFF